MLDPGKHMVLIVMVILVVAWILTLFLMLVLITNMRVHWIFILLAMRAEWCHRAYSNACIPTFALR